MREPITLQQQVPTYVRQKRRRLYSQEAIARELGVCRDTITTLEGNMFAVRGTLLARYGALLGYRFSWLPDRRRQPDALTLALNPGP